MMNEQEAVMEKEVTTEELEAQVKEIMAVSDKLFDLCKKYGIGMHAVIDNPVDDNARHLCVNQVPEGREGGVQLLQYALVDLMLSNED